MFFLINIDIIQNHYAVVVNLHYIDMFGDSPLLRNLNLPYTTPFCHNICPFLLNEHFLGIAIQSPFYRLLILLHIPIVKIQTQLYFLPFFPR